MSPKGKILVVDDDRLVLATVTHGLAKAGYEVVDADNGDDAILLARQHRPDLALLDIRMEGMSGFDVAAYLRESLQTPFMFLSAFSDDATAAQVKALGAVAYLVKPLDISQIVPTVESALGAARAQRARLRDAVELGTAANFSSADNLPAQVPLEPAALNPLADAVPIAVGVLMHRYSLARIEALERLQRMAASDGVTPAVQAERLLSAVELLARPASV